MRQITTLFELLVDGVRLLMPRVLFIRAPYRFAFLVHPRDTRDIVRKIPLLRAVPPRGVRWFERYFWPAVIARITGLTSRDTGTPIEGFVISIPMTAKTMLDDRPAALAQIRKAVHLAQKRGARIVGLGALTSSLTHGGAQLTDIDGIGITTGHAYTGYNVVATARKVTATLEMQLEECTVAVVGAAGSIGSMSAELLLHGTPAPHALILVDIPRKKESVESLATRLRETYRHGTITVAERISAIADAHIVITATNAHETLITNEHLAPGTIVVDDAQPSDVHPDVFENPEVLVVSAGAVYTPHIETHFPMGLHGKHTNYCCLAEVLILAAEERESHYVLRRATLEKVIEISRAGEALGFSVAPLQNERGHIDDATLHRVGKSARTRLRRAAR